MEPSVGDRSLLGITNLKIVIRGSRGTGNRCTLVPILFTPLWDSLPAKLKAIEGDLKEFFHL